MRRGSAAVRRGSLMLALAAGLLALGPVPASADHHFMKVREVFPGSTTNPGQDFVELQMYAGSQQFVSGHQITIYDADGGAPVHTFTFPGNAGNGDNQRTILVGAASSVVGVTPDFPDAGIAALDPAGGAACFDSTTLPGIDCVAWGSFTGTGLPSPPGAPAAAIDDGMSLTRTISPNCPTLLEDADDTDSSSTDFAQTTPSPRNNATAPTESPCPPPPNTAITKKPRARTTDRTPKFEFNSPGNPGATFKCKLDQGAYEECTSPHRPGRLSRGRHTFSVKAGVGAAEDPSPASYTWRIVRP